MSKGDNGEKVEQKVVRVNFQNPEEVAAVMQNRAQTTLGMIRGGERITAEVLAENQAVIMFTLGAMAKNSADARAEFEKKQAETEDKKGRRVVGARIVPGR